MGKNAAEDEWDTLPEELLKLYDNLQKRTPNLVPQDMPTTTYFDMSQQLYDCTQLLSRMHVLARFLASAPGMENYIRRLFVMRIQLMRQFKYGREWSLNISFTISPEYLNAAQYDIERLYRVMDDHLNTFGHSERF